MHDIGLRNILSPIGEYIRLKIMKRLMESPATVEEINSMLSHIEGYNWCIWPKLFSGEIEIVGNKVVLTEYGKWLYKQTKEIIEEYVRKHVHYEL